MAAVRVAGHISVIGILTGVAGPLPLVPALIARSGSRACWSAAGASRSR